MARTVGIVIIVLFLLAAPFAAGAQPGFELDYGSVPGVDQPGGSGGQALAEFVQMLYNVLLIIGVAVAVGVVLIAGFRYLTAAASGKVENTKDAKQRLVGAALGLGVLFSSALILSAIDPNLTLLPVRDVPAVEFPENATTTDPVVHPRDAETYTTLEEDTTSLTSFLQTQIADWSSAFFETKVETLFNNLDKATERTCADTRAFCSPRGLEPVPIRCEWKDKEIEDKIAEQVNTENLEELKQMIETLVDPPDQQTNTLDGTVKQIQNCMRDPGRELWINAQAKEEGHLDFLNIPDSERDPLTLYCFSNFAETDQEQEQIDTSSRKQPTPKTVVPVVKAQQNQCRILPVGQVPERVLEIHKELVFLFTAAEEEYTHMLEMAPRMLSLVKQCSLDREENQGKCEIEKDLCPDLCEPDTCERVSACEPADSDDNDLCDVPLINDEGEKMEDVTVRDAIKELFGKIEEAYEEIQSMKETMNKLRNELTVLEDRLTSGSAAGLQNYDPEQWELLNCPQAKNSYPGQVRDCEPEQYTMFGQPVGNVRPESTFDYFLCPK